MIFTRWKKYTNVFFYMILLLIGILYIKIIASLCNNIKMVYEKGFIKLFDEKFSVWFYQSEENLILYNSVLIFIFILCFCLSCVFIKKKRKLSLLVLIIPILLILCEIVFTRYMLR